MGDSGEHAFEAWPKFAPWPSTCPDCNWNVSVVFTLPAVATALVYTNRSLAACTVACCYLLLCLPAAANLLGCGIPGCSDCSCCTWKCMHVLVEISINFMLFAIPMRHWQVCALVHMMESGNEKYNNFFHSLNCFVNFLLLAALV